MRLWALPPAEPSEKKGRLNLSDLRCQEAGNVNNSGKVSILISNWTELSIYQETDSHHSKGTGAEMWVFVPVLEIRLKESL